MPQPSTPVGVNVADQWYVRTHFGDVVREHIIFRLIAPRDHTAPRLGARQVGTSAERWPSMTNYGGEAVAHDMFALLHEAAAPVVTRWNYCTDDPFAVTVEIQTRGNRFVDWVLARDLLVAGLSAPAGIGDVRVRPANMGDWEVTLVEIRSLDGHAVLEVDRDLLAQFVQATIDAVPLGSESLAVDIDAEIEKITRSCAD